jgi:hypothetical protein
MITTSFSAAISCIRNASPDLVEKAKSRSDIKGKQGKNLTGMGRNYMGFGIDPLVCLS